MGVPATPTPMPSPASITTRHDAVAATPSTATVMAQPSAKRGGAAQKWKRVATKSRAAVIMVAHMHEVKHQLQHRAQEWALFAVAYHLLERVAMYVAATVHVASVMELGFFMRIRTAPKVWVAKASGWLRRVSRRVRNLPAAPAAVGHAAAVQGGSSATTATCLHACHVCLPLLGAYLLVGMVRHDVHAAHRAHHENQHSFTIALFWVAIVGDALNAAAHLALGLGQLAHLDHHTEHQLHEAASWAAQIACVAIVMAEVARERRSRVTHRIGAPKTIKAE